jgi:hypothetical protein
MSPIDRMFLYLPKAKGLTAQRNHLTTAGLAIALIASASTATFAADKPPLIADKKVPASTSSSVSATLQFSLSSLDRALERKIPRRLASINDRGSSCWHRRILGRMVNIDCEYSGYVERTGPVSLRAENGRLVATMPLFGTVSGQGIGRFARLLHGTGEGALTVYATSRPQLRPDWSVALDMSEGFRWQEPPVLQILGFRIDLTRYIEPKIRAQISSVQRDAAKSVAAMNIRGKAESAWRQMFTPVKIIDSPAVWLTMTPSSVAFAGMRARGDALEGSIEIAGSTATTIGSEPPSMTPTPLPALTRDVENPGQFSVIVPIDINYDQIRQKIQSFMTARTQSGGPGVKEISVYPSAGKIVAGLHLEPGGNTNRDAWIYITATPAVDANAQTLQFSDLSVAAGAEDGSSTAFGDPAFLQALQQQLSQTFQAEWQAALASANTRLSRPLGDGFRSEGHLASAGLSGISLLADGIRVNLRASGELRILYGL